VTSVSAPPAPPPALVDALEDVRGWTLDVLGRVVAVPSATDAASDLADVLAPLLEELGMVTERVPCAPDDWRGHPDHSPPPTPPPGAHDGVIGRPAGHPPGAPGLLLFAHTDTEPVHPGWTGDPLRLRVEDGRATGLGVADDAAGVVAILAALRAVRAAGLRPVRPPVVLLAPGKQGGAIGTLPGVVAAGGAGARGVATKGAAGGVAAAVYCHPAESGRGLADLKVASRGIVRLRVTVPGATPPPREERTPVSADPREGRNPLTRAARIATAVAGWDDGHDGSSGARDVGLRDDGSSGARDVGLRGEDRVWAVLRVDGGGAPFEVPASAVLEVACWSVADGPDDVLAAFRARCAALDADPWERAHLVTVEAIGLRAWPASCAGSALADRAARTVAAVTGTAPEPYAWHSASDIRFPMRCLGVPAVGLGPLAGGFYGPDEWVDLASLYRTVEVLARLLLDVP